MTIPSVQQYLEVIKHDVLLDRQLDALRLLYQFPKSTATAKQLSVVADPGRESSSITSFRIGKTGKRIADYLGIIPPTYLVRNKMTPAYSLLVSKEYKTNIGWTMHQNLQQALKELELVGMKSKELNERLPTEISLFSENQFFNEGKISQVFVNKFERKLQARIACLKQFGHKCYACGFDFGSFYGKLADGFIEVHHLIPLSKIRQEYLVDPVKDLVPLCSNCHSVIHLSKPMLTIDELKSLIKKNGR
jgi:5-methylcytosine-specific restriction protein A